MKIVFFSHLDLNLYLFRLSIMKELVKRGYKVYALVPRGEYFEKFKEVGIEAIEYEIDRSSLNPLKELRTIQSIRKIIKKINPDILHSFTHKPNIYGAFFGVRNFIQTITGLGSFFIYNDLKSKIVREIILNGYKISSKKAKKVIFQNSDDLSLFLRKGIVEEEKAVLIKSSGIDTNEWKVSSKIKNSKVKVLMVSRVIKDKGVEEFIKAADLLKEKAKFLYIGGVDRGNKNAFFPDWKSVKYLGFKEKEEVKKIMKEVDIVVLPSFREGVPRTLLEAASMSKPIVATDVPGCREVVEDGVNGFLVPVRDYKSLAKKIETLIENEALRDKFGKMSRKKAVEEFDIKKVVDKYLKVYEEILGV